MSHGAARTVSALTTNAIANAAFRMVEASVHDSSRSRVVMNSTKIGTTIVARISPSTSWYTMLGISFAKLYGAGASRGEGGRDNPAAGGQQRPRAHRRRTDDDRALTDGRCTVGGLEQNRERERPGHASLGAERDRLHAAVDGEVALGHVRERH